MIRTARVALGGVAHEAVARADGRGSARRPAGRRGALRRPRPSGARRARSRERTTRSRSSWRERAIVRALTHSGGRRLNGAIMHWHDSLVGKPLDRVDGRAQGDRRAATTRPRSRRRDWPTPCSSAAPSRSGTHRAASTPRRAEQAPGVLAVLTHENAPKLPTEAIAACRRRGEPHACTLLQDDRVHYNGQPVAVVVADTLEQAHARRRAGARRVRRRAADADARTPAGRGRTRPKLIGAGQRTPTAATAARRDCRRPPVASTPPTRRRSSTTTRWSRTRRSPSGTATSA